MKHMDKGLTVPKWVLINWQKIPQKTAKVSVQIVCPSPKVWYFDEKRLHWTSVVRGTEKVQGIQQNLSLSSLQATLMDSLVLLIIESCFN